MRQRFESVSRCRQTPSPRSRSARRGDLSRLRQHAPQRMHGKTRGSMALGPRIRGGGGNQPSHLHLIQATPRDQALSARAIAYGHNMSSCRSKTRPDEPQSPPDPPIWVPRGQDQPAKAPSTAGRQVKKSQMQLPCPFCGVRFRRVCAGLRPYRLRFVDGRVGATMGGLPPPPRGGWRGRRVRVHHLPI